MTRDLIAHLAFGHESAHPHPHDLRRPVARAEAQQSYASLFSPVDPSDFSLPERWLVAAFATALSTYDPAAHAPTDPTAQYYATGATQHAPTAAAALSALLAQSHTPGPYGAYAEPGLAAEHTDGTRLHLSADTSPFTPREAAALTHTHLLVTRPREANVDSQQHLLDADWTPTGIVTLSQLVSFLAFQQRVVVGLRALTPKGQA